MLLSRQSTNRFGTSRSLKARDHSLSPTILSVLKHRGHRGDGDGEGDRDVPLQFNLSFDEEGAEREELGEVPSY